MTQETVVRADPAPAPAAPRPPGRLRRLATALRPLLFLAAAAGAVALVGIPSYHPQNPLLEYAMRATVVGAVVAAAAGWWWSLRRGTTWGFDLVPALLGGISAMALVGSLNGTPYAPGGLAGDQSFRTAAITRFADTWHTADFTFQGLPSFYAPAYFWVLGRTADLAGLDAWRMAKVGTILTALAVPMLTYLLWRRLVPIQVAALLAVVPLVVENFYEPYAWLVLFAIVPWWLEAVHGLRRPGRAPGNLAFLGLVGGLLFMTYYYFFFIAAIAFLLHLVVERMLGQLRWRQLRRAAAALGIAAAVSAVYWLPLAVSLLRADHVQSLANRWFNTSHPRLPLPMVEASVTGVLALLGLAYLVWTARRSPLSRGLLVFLVAAYGWYLLGAPAAVAGSPLLSFRGKPLIPMILLIGGVLGLVTMLRWAAIRARRPGGAADMRRVAGVVAVVLVVYAGQEFISTVRNSPLTEVAHATALPDSAPPDPPPAQLHRAITDHFGENARPVLLSDRVDIVALYPYFGFLQWNAHYAHPAAGFDARVEFLTELAALSDPAEFARRSRDNEFDRIDGFVLRDEGEELTLRVAGDAFPAGLQPVEIRFPRTLFAPADFTQVLAGDHVLLLHRP